MKKTILVGVAILAVSTSGALAAKKTTKPKAPATAAASAANTGGAAPLSWARLVLLTARYMRKINANPA
jgi:hypothetical protein